MSDWLSIIIGILIVGIVLDGVRRARNARRHDVRLSKNARKADKLFEQENTTGDSTDFPSGGARLKESRLSASMEHPEQASLDLDDPVPMLMESVEQQESLGESDLDSEDQAYADVALAADPMEPNIGSLDDLDVVESHARHEEPPVHSSTDKKSKLSAASDYFSKEKKRHDPSSNKAIADKPPKEILVINVMAKVGEVFQGEALLAALTQLKLKYGNMGIFHRHLDNDGDAAPIYSLANIVEPGSFNLATIHESVTPGLCMFLSLPTDCAAVDAYEDLVFTAQELARMLNGELKDENRSALTNQTIEHDRQRVLEFERKYQLQK